MQNTNVKTLLEYFGQKENPSETKKDSETTSVVNSTSSSANPQSLSVDSSVVRLENVVQRQRHLWLDSVSSRTSDTRSVQFSVRKKGSPMSSKAKNPKKALKLPEKSELSLMFDRIRCKNAQKTSPT